jgi:hypothetical protein
MSNSTSEEGVVSPLVHRFKDLYLSIFVLFFRVFADSWSPRTNAMKGVNGITLVEFVIAVSVSDLVQVQTGRHLALNRWVIGFAFVMVALVNRHFLVVRGSGVAFEREFNSFGKSKRIALRSVSVGLVLATAVIFFFSAAAYHRAIGIR